MIETQKTQVTDLPSEIITMIITEYIKTEKYLDPIRAVCKLFFNIIILLPKFKAPTTESGVLYSPDKSNAITHWITLGRINLVKHYSWKDYKWPPLGSVALTAAKNNQFELYQEFTTTTYHIHHRDATYITEYINFVKYNNIDALKYIQEKSGKIFGPSSLYNAILEIEPAIFKDIRISTIKWLYSGFSFGWLFTSTTYHGKEKLLREIINNLAESVDSNGLINPDKLTTELFAKVVSTGDKFLSRWLYYQGCPYDKIAMDNARKIDDNITHFWLATTNIKGVCYKGS